MSLLDELNEEYENPQIREKDVYFPPNKTFKTEVVWHEEFTTDDDVTYFKIKAKVLESSTEDIKPGMICTQMIKKHTSKKLQGMYARNVLSFVDPAVKSYVVQNGKPEPSTQEVKGFLPEVLANPETLAGTKVFLKTSTKDGSDEGFTHHNWIKITDEQ